MPMFIQGLAGLSRRMYDGGQQYAHASDVLQWNEFILLWNNWFSYNWFINMDYRVLYRYRN